MPVIRHKVTFSKERYSSFEVEKIMLDFGNLLLTNFRKKTDVDVLFEHKGIVSKKQDYIN